MRRAPVRRFEPSVTILRCPCTAAAVTSSRSPVRPTSPIACCARWRSRRSIIAAPSSPRWGARCSTACKTVFQTTGPVVIFPASGTGAWEAALVNTLSPGDKVLAFEIGEFARLWAEVAQRLGLDVEVVPRDWRRGVDPGGRRSEADGGPRASHPGGARRAQRDVDRRHEPAAGDPPGDRSRQAIRRCCSSTRCRRWRRSICGTTSGASTSRWRVRRRG